MQDYPCGHFDSLECSGLVESEHLDTKRNIWHFNDLFSKSYSITSALATECLCGSNMNYVWEGNC